MTHGRSILLSSSFAAALALGACGGSASGTGGSSGSGSAPATCAEAAAAVCNAATGCGSSHEASLASCQVGVVWTSTAVCIDALTKNCGPGAVATPEAPKIASPDACTTAVPFACTHDQAQIPASCVTCVSIAVDAG